MDADLQPVDGPRRFDCPPELLPRRFDCPPELLFTSPTDPRGGEVGDLSDLDVGELDADGNVIPVHVPLWVRAVTDGFEIIFGHRRAAKARLTGLPTVPIEVHDLSDRDVRLLQLREVLQRKALSPVQEAHAYAALRDDLCFPITEICARLRLSPRRVHERLALLSLCAEALAELEQGRLALGVAVELSTVRKLEDQRDALKDVLDREMDARYAISMIRREYHLALAEAPFDQEDPYLVQGAPPCSRCTKNSARQRELFDIEKDEKARCTDRVCFEEKKRAGADRKLAEARAAGAKVVDAKVDPKAAEAFGKGYFTAGPGKVDLDQGCHRDPKHRTYRQLLGDKAEASTVVRTERGEVHELLTERELHKALKDAGHGKLLEQPKPAKPPKPAREVDLERKAEQLAEERLLTALAAAAAKKEGIAFLRFATVLMMHNAEPLGLTPIARRYAPPVAKSLRRGARSVSAASMGELATVLRVVEKADEGALRGLLVQGLVLLDLDNLARELGDTESLLAIACRGLGVDGAKILSEAMAEVKGPPPATKKAPPELAIACETCGAKAGEACKTPGGKPRDDPHAPRRKAVDTRPAKAKSGTPSRVKGFRQAAKPAKAPKASTPAKASKASKASKAPFRSGH